MTTGEIENCTGHDFGVNILRNCRFMSSQVFEEGVVNHIFESHVSSYHMFEVGVANKANAINL